MQDSIFKNKEFDEFNEIKEQFFDQLIERITPELAKIAEDIELALNIVAQAFDAIFMYKLACIAINKEDVGVHSVLLAICAEIHGAMDIEKPKNIKELHKMLHFKKLNNICLEHVKKVTRKWQ